ncbi:MAG: ribonuclease, Rne/Rng family, partial [Mycobacterium sp.]|nr:ribonuclease, Rne/Rng family [Mycobacterium sp.]
MAEDAHTQDLSEDTQPGQDPLAEQLSDDAPPIVEVFEEAVVPEPVLVEPVDEPADEGAADAPIEDDEPESRLMLETPAAPAASEPAAYMPLFVAPQPVTYRAPAPPVVVVADDDDDDDDDEDDDDADDESGDNDDDQGDRPAAARRRRRGRRGRGRGRGEQNPDDPSDDDGADDEAADQSDADDDSDDEGTDDENGSGEGGNRRRRRRRRRKSGAGDGDEAVSPDDPPNTVVHERPPREKAAKAVNNEIQGISGSTRLEAKRQRRRDGRDAGRRRPPILSEAEFLARREAVERVMVVRDKVRTEPPHEGARYTQIAVLEDGVLVEHFVTSAASASLVGNIYLGIVQNVLPCMEAAFVDIGKGRNAVLYAGEVNWDLAGLVGRARSIEQALRSGDSVLVQVTKDPMGHKGARLSSQI